MSKEEELIKYLEETTTWQVLKDINCGRKPREADIKLINDIQEKTGLPTGVINVLTEYVFLSSNNKLVRPYMEKIADHWASVKLEDTKGAMYFAKKHSEKYREWSRTTDTQKIEATPVERERIRAIKRAIDSGLDNEKLGKFVRTMFNESITE